MSILNYASMESDDIVAELITLQGEHGRLKSKYEIACTENSELKDKLDDLEKRHTFAVDAWNREIDRASGTQT